MHGLARGLCPGCVRAALFRTIEAWRPSLLIDEADRFLRANDEANVIINAGHTRRMSPVVHIALIAQLPQASEQ